MQISALAYSDTLLDKVWESHTVVTLPSGKTQPLVGLYLIYKATSPQTFAMTRDRGLKVAYTERIINTCRNRS